MEQTKIVNNNSIPPIDSHFLYNTLDAINWVALERQEYTISRMLTSLAATLRYTIHDSKEKIKVEEEAEYLRKFIYLQQQRFDYGFGYSITVEEEAKEIQIPRLLIQPVLVSVLETAKPGKEGNIRICFQKREEKLEITIEIEGMKKVNEDVVEGIREKLLDTYGTQAKIRTDNGYRLVLQIPSSK